MGRNAGLGSLIARLAQGLRSDVTCRVPFDFDKFSKGLIISTKRITTVS